MNLIRRCDLKCLLLLKGCVNLASWLPLAEGQSSRSLLWTILEFRVDMCDSWIPHFGGEKFKQDNRMFNLHSDVICYHKKGRDPAILEHAVCTSWIRTSHINFVKHTHFMKSTSAALSETGILVIVLWRLDECHPAYLYKPCRRPLKSSMVRGGGG